MWLVQLAAVTLAALQEQIDTTATNCNAADTSSEHSIHCLSHCVMDGCSQCACQGQGQIYSLLGKAYQLLSIVTLSTLLYPAILTVLLQLFIMIHQ